MTPSIPGGREYLLEISSRIELGGPVASIEHSGVTIDSRRKQRQKAAFASNGRLLLTACRSRFSLAATMNKKKNLDR